MPTCTDSILPFLCQATPAICPLLTDSTVAGPDVVANSTHHMSSSIWGCLGPDSPQLLVVEADDLYRKHLNVGKRLQDTKGSRFVHSSPSWSEGGTSSNQCCLCDCFCQIGEGRAFRTVDFGGVKPALICSAALADF